MAVPARLAVLVTAAGRSERFGPSKKELLDLGGRSVLDRAVAPFISLPGLIALVLTAPPGCESELRASLSGASLTALESRLGERFLVVAGGATRRDSVRLGLETLVEVLARTEGGRVIGGADEAVVLVHDGARPWASSALAARVAAIAAEKGACVPVTALVDTPKEIGPDGAVVGHPPRSTLAAAQTPQGFRLGPLLAAHRLADTECVDCTDDAELWDRFVGPVASTPGEAANRKITFRGDLPNESRNVVFRVGQGWDIHRLAADRPLVLGGARIASEQGEVGHSDGDVLLHAIIDALLGAAALGDIGFHFPPSDERWKGADSRDLARRAVALVREAGWEPGNLDCTVILERPKLGPHRDEIRDSIAGVLGIAAEAVSVKAKTKEGLDATGEGGAVEAQAIVVLFGR